MAASSTYLAVFTGSANGAERKAWDALPAAERTAREQAGIAAWKAWAQTHQASIVEMGGPLGKTKKVSRDGVHDVSNLMAGFTLVRAASHEEAAKLFENHPHFAIFPGDGVEIMPVLAIPAG